MLQRLARPAGLFVGALALAALPLRAQTPAPGFELESLANPAFLSVTCTLPGGDLVTFDGVTVDRWTASGAFVQSLGSLPGLGFTFASFATPTPDGTAVLIGESGDGGTHTGALFLAPLDGSGVVHLTDLAFNYDGQFLPSGDLIVSAATGQNGPDNDLVRVTLSPLATTFVGSIAGPSGPLAVNAGGDLFYATQVFPQPPASTDVIYWTAAQLASGAFLDAGNATLFSSGYDGGASLAFDPLRDRPYLAEANFGLGVFRIRRVRKNSAHSEVVLESDAWVSNLQFVSPGGSASFDPYQPEDGLQLAFTRTDFSTVSDTHRLHPRRPQLAVSGPGTSGPGLVTLTLTGGVPNGTAFLTLSEQTNLLPGEVRRFLPGFFLHTYFAPGKTRRTPFYLPADANGDTSFQFYNPGGYAGLYAYQFLVGTSTGKFVGSSETALF
jgi:hypothetical protein